MSDSVASALQIIDEEGTRETRLFIRMTNRFFDCLNAKSPVLAKLKRNDGIAPYKSSSDQRFKVVLILYLKEKGQSMYRDIKTMNIEVEKNSSDWLEAVSQPLQKRKRV